jgi:ATP-dependent Clp protease ATP-binding subunit ClpA
MFERFSDPARAIVVDAQAHARRLGHGFIGCEHLLLAVVSGDNDASEELRAAGLTLAAVEAATLRIVGTPVPDTSRSRLGRRSARSSPFAKREPCRPDRSGSSIALALTAITRGVVPEIFAAQGASQGGVRTRILDRFRQAS